jgi:hypothetical protein
VAELGHSAWPSQIRAGCFPAPGSSPHGTTRGVQGFGSGKRVVRASNRWVGLPAGIHSANVSCAACRSSRNGRAEHRSTSDAAAAARVWMIGETIVGSIFWLFHTDHSCGDIVETAAYFDNPWGILGVQQPGLLAAKRPEGIRPHHRLGLSKPLGAVSHKSAPRRPAIQP